MGIEDTLYGLPRIGRSLPGRCKSSKIDEHRTCFLGSLAISMVDLPHEILALPVEDRIQLAMSIWDRVAEESEYLAEEDKHL